MTVYRHRSQNIFMLTIPFYKPSIGQAEIDEVVDCLKSGWLTTGPKTKQFEAEFARYIQHTHAVAHRRAASGTRDDRPEGRPESCRADDDLRGHRRGGPLFQRHAAAG